jgi:hypothetical protein
MDRPFAYVARVVYGDEGLLYEWSQIAEHLHAGMLFGFNVSGP